VVWLTLGQTRTQETGDLLDEGLGSDEGIVFASKLLDELLVLVKLLQVVGRHGIDTAVLGTVEIVLVTQDAVVWHQLAAFAFSSEKSLGVGWRHRTRWPCWGGGPRAA